MSLGRILVVEDDNDLRNVCELILSHAGYTVCTAINGKEGIAEVDECEPQLVLLDIFMPIMDGKSFLKNVSLNLHPHMKVVVYSNTSDKILMDEMVTLGADKVVMKSGISPVDLIELVKPYFIASSTN